MAVAIDPAARNRIDVVRCVLALAVVAAALAGCASVVSSGRSTVAIVELDAPGFPDRPAGYRLVRRDGVPVASAGVQDGRIRFELPPDREVGVCVAALDAGGRSITAGGRAIALVLRAQDEALVHERQALDADRIGAVAAERAARSSLEAVEARLNGHRVVAGRCERPAERPAPPRPAASCLTADGCLGHGAAACFTRYFGAEGCGRARDALQLPGLPTAQQCAAAVAALARRRPDLESATVEALNQAAAEAARGLQNSDDPFGRTLGNLLAGAGDSIRTEAAMACSRAHGERLYAPIRAWLAETDRIRAEPDEALASCRRDAAAVEGLRQEAAGAALHAQQAQARLAAIDGQRAALGARQQPLEWCEPAFAAAADRR